MAAASATISSSQAIGTETVSGHSKISLHVLVSNTDAVGTLKVQGSNDKTNWVDVGFMDENGDYQTELAVSSGVDVNHCFDVTDLGMYYVQLYYTSTSGSGTLTLHLQMKN